MEIYNSKASGLYIFRKSPLFESTKPTIESIRCHLKLGTIRFKFYDLQTKQLVDEINITKPFILKAQAWNGKFNKDGSYRFVSNNELSKICFQQILDNGFYEFIKGFHYKLFTKESAIKKARRLCKTFCLDNEYDFLFKELKHYHKDGFDWHIPELVTDYYYDNEQSKAKRVLKILLARKGKYVRQFSVQEVVEHKALRFRSGMNYRYKKFHGKEFPLGAYFLDYLYYLEEFLIDGHIITADNVKSKYLEDIKFRHRLDFPPSTGVGMANSLVAIHHNWGAIALLSSEQKKDPAIVEQVFNFNPQTPANLLSEFFDDKTNALEFISKPGVEVSTFHKYFDDKEIALRAMQVRADVTYPMLNKVLKSDPDILKLTNSSCVQYFPSELKKDKGFLIKFGADINSRDRVVTYAHKSIRNDLDFLMSLIEDDHDDSFMCDKIIFDKKLLDDLKATGATVQIKGEKVEITPSVIECFKGLDGHDLYCIENPTKGKSTFNNTNIIWNPDLSKESIKSIMNSNSRNHRIYQHSNICDLDIEAIAKIGAVKLERSSTAIIITYDDLKKVQTKRFSDRLGSTLSGKTDRPKRMKI